MIKNESSTNASSLNLSEIKHDPEINAMIAEADRNLRELGFTEHGIRHVSVVSNTAKDVLAALGYDEHLQKLAAIAGYTHDVGNVVSRRGHATLGAVMIQPILNARGMCPTDVLVVMGAIGSHGDETSSIGEPVHPVSAALILADKSDVHRTRVVNPDPLDFDEHEQMNYATTSSRLDVDTANSTITLELEIDTRLASVMKYFELFMPRMRMCMRAANLLGQQFSITINQVAVL